MAAEENFAKKVRALAPALSDQGVRLLRHMYESEQLLGADGELVTVGNTLISVEQGASLHVLARSATSTLEVGFALGFSTIWILDSLAGRPGTSHCSIDPFETGPDWHGVGLRQVQQLATGVPFRWIEEFSIHALSQMIKRRERFDLIFIDGNHRFDDVLVDFYLSDQVLVQGGFIAFDDLWLPSVRTAVSFVATNRNYQPVTQPAENMAVFRKLADDDRGWQHFETFKVYDPSKRTGARAWFANRVSK